MKLLLHMCCAPCATGVLKKLTDTGNVSVFGLYYNPNIHPEQENSARLASVQALSRDEQFPVFIEEAMMLDYWKEKLQGEKELRCSTCYALRVDRMAEMTRERGMDAFTTSLLISPWQNHETIKRLCEAAAEKYKVDFLYQDFRPYYREGKNEAWRRGYYMQKYCGCVYSYQESDHKKKPVYYF
ncbi:MAG: epoxyqueuosine reductase QueH [Clostridiaceae bacterium]|jgi:predicted adenine nucleotide alpha hydrolase (AANH) superfamily ATPase|nr:epoxyqueuosine reductase QueH [Clostridiaceae bacterium]